MALNAKRTSNNSNKVEQPLIEPDVYPSYLVQIIDLGLQPQKAFKGKEKPPVQEVMFTYELSDCFMLDDEGKEDEKKPRWISETLPFYGLFADKAKSTMRYYAFDPTEAFDGDITKAIGMPCNLTTANNVVGEKTYTNVANVAGISAKKAAAMNELKNPLKVFDCDEPDMEVFNSLPDWIKDKIKANLNFKGSVLEAALGGKPAAPKQEKAKAPPVVEADDEDSNPY
jgi:hypothetical protein